MEDGRIEEILRETLGDNRLSRAEKKALSRLLADMGGERRLVSDFRKHAFEMARADLDSRHHVTLNWLEALIKVLLGHSTLPQSRVSRAWFSPGPDCLVQIRTSLASARKTADICVFTITDDRITKAILEAHRCGVVVRVISDNEKSYDTGSDVYRMAEAGIAVRIDQSEAHMHHKYAIFDGVSVLTGSYNWTRSAEQRNEENLILISEVPTVGQFQREFDKLWQEVVPIKTTR